MAPIDPLRLTSRDKTDRAAQAATFELVGRAAHNLILHVVLESVRRSQETLPLLVSSPRRSYRIIACSGAASHPRPNVGLRVANAGAGSQTDFGSAEPNRPRRVDSSPSPDASGGRGCAESGDWLHGNRTGGVRSRRDNG